MITKNTEDVQLLTPSLSSPQTERQQVRGGSASASPDDGDDDDKGEEEDDDDDDNALPSNVTTHHPASSPVIDTAHALRRCARAARHLTTQPARAFAP